MKFSINTTKVTEINNQLQVLEGNLEKVKQEKTTYNSGERDQD